VRRTKGFIFFDVADLQEEEDSLNKQVMQRITGGGSGGSAGAGDRSLH